MAERRTTAQRLADLEQKNDELRLRLAHLEELHRMQSLPIFWDKFIVDYEGPTHLFPGKITEDEVKCFLCPRPINDGDLGYELQTRRAKDLLNYTIHTRTVMIHAECFLKAAHKPGCYHKKNDLLIIKTD